MKHITLTDHDIEVAKKYGKLRREANRAIGTIDQKTPYLDGDHIDLIGVKGEMAASLATGIPWINRYTKPENLGPWLTEKKPDLGTNIEVRTCTSPYHRLLVRKHNPTDWKYIHVILLNEKELLVDGWAHGTEIKQQKYWEPKLPQPAYAYPRHQLHPIETLPEMQTT